MKLFPLLTALMFASHALWAQGAPRPAKVFTVTQQDAQVVRRYPGVVLPSEEVELSFRISGNLVELPIRGSMQVSKGDVIGQLDVRDYETQAAQLQSQLDQAEAQLDILRTGARPQEIAALEASVDAAQAQVDQTRDQTERSRALASSGTISAARLEEDEAALRVAEAQLRTSIENLELAREGGRPEEIASAEAAIRGIEAQIEAIENTIDDATLRAPFGGIIARRDVDNFANVSAGQSIALLQALAVIHVSFDVPAPDVTSLTAGGVDKIVNQVQLDTLPGQTLAAETVEFSVQADNATQTYRGRVAVNVPAGAIVLPGMVGTVISSAPFPAPQMRVPLAAVSAATDGAPRVWVVDDAGKVSDRPVELGEVVGLEVEVLSGLESGETIVSAGVNQLTAGMTIRPVTKIGG
ncbi:MAG: efflux RND transporter periplasmic adaptor subunit [Arenibacterium sp.]